MVSRYPTVTIDGVPRVIDALKNVGPRTVTYEAPGTVTTSSLDGNKSVVSWTAVSGAIAYEVWESKTATPLATIAAPATSRTSGVIAVDVYNYRVRAVFADGGKSDFTYGPPVSVGTAAPTNPTEPTTPVYAAPTTVVTTLVNGNQAQVSWTAVTGAEAYEVWEANTTGTPVATITAPTVTRLSGALAPNTYTYSVRALFAGGGVSPFKASAAVTVVTSGGTGTDPGPGTPTPVPTSYPNANNTGVADPSLLPSIATAGNLNSVGAGQVIENRFLAGHIVVNHPNVTVRNCRVVGNNAYAGLIFTGNASAENTLVEDCEFGPDGATQLTSDAFNGKNFNYTMRRCKIHNLTDGTKMGAGVFEDNYIYNIGPRDTAHHDGVQIMGNGGGVTYIRHNTITIGLGKVGAYNATVFIKSDASAIGTVYVENNYVDGCGFTFKWGGGPNGYPTKVYATGNRFGHNSPYGQISTGLVGDYASRQVLSNNAFLDGVGTIKIV